MKKTLYLLFFSLVTTLSLNAQVAGDTIITSTFNYTQTQFSRDTMIQFPDLPGVTYEKIYMMYNLRCKDGLISSNVAGQTNIGCGEWDYTCNTYIMDSTRTDSVKTKHPSHIITGFAGQSYNYTTQPTYTYYNYQQQNVVYNNVISETTATVGSGLSNNNAPLNTQHATSKSQFLWTAAELSAAGLTAGNITSLRLQLNNAGSAAQFLKISMKHSAQNVLNASTPELSGFTEVYFLNTALVNGMNQFNFYTPFNWNGTDNILVEFSFTNPANGINSTLSSDITPNVSGLIIGANDYSFEFTGSNSIHLGNPNFNNISNELTLSFWAYGTPQNLPANTSLFHAVNAQNQRQVNIHMPWSNSSIYWDCGANGGNYNRIEKPATNNEIEGQWNHWAFTKNATSGIMNIYLNGALWHTGTGKTLPINPIADFRIGNAQDFGVPYFGKIDELSIWKKEIAMADIQSWMNKSITAAHPNYTDLVAYYPYNEGTGSLTNDISPLNVVSNVDGTPLWRLTRGENLFKNFTETSNRPMVTFVQGVYSQTINTVAVLDSVVNAPNTVYSFAVQNGVIVPVDTNVYYQAGYSYIYDAITNAVIDSVLNPTQNTINISQLIYYKKYPSAYQMVSFVTPYGIFLDLGQNGKTWTFDVTDYAPILKGWKRMFINGGGERQEDMDIKFVFIVGTPPQNVVDCRNIWKVDNAGYGAIMNDDMFEPRNVALNPNAVSYKIKTAITGHGQEGEFIPRNHYINIAGGNKEFMWDVWKPCASNPVYPQGGTWIYDRAGWCPGMATDVKEMNITPFVSPGAVANIDYGLDTAWGSSNYWVSNILVSYGAPNFALDAAVIDIKNPTTKVEYARTNPVCSNPIVTIRNTGSTVLNSLNIDYWVNGNPQHETYSWSGNLAFMESVDVSLPFSNNLWSAVSGPTGNIFHVEIRDPNNGADAYVHNNKFNSNFDISNVVPSNFFIWFKTNLAGAESKYEIIDENGNQIFLRDNLANNTNYRDTFHLGWGCYSFVIHDVEEDGIDFWANNDGVGFARFRTLTGQTIKNFEGDFGKSLIYNFTVDFPLSYEQLQGEKEIAVYPNPGHDQFTIAGKNIDDSEIRISNQIGQTMTLPCRKEEDKIVVDARGLTPGIYFILIRDEMNKTYSRKILIE